MKICAGLLGKVNACVPGQQQAVRINRPAGKELLLRLCGGNLPEIEFRLANVCSSRSLHMERRQRYIILLATIFLLTSASATAGAISIFSPDHAISSLRCGTQFFCPMVATKSPISESILRKSLRRPFQVSICDYER